MAVTLPCQLFLDDFAYQIFGDRVQVASVSSVRRVPAHQQCSDVVLWPVSEKVYWHVAGFSDPLDHPPVEAHCPIRVPLQAQVCETHIVRDDHVVDYSLHPSPLRNLSQLSSSTIGASSGHPMTAYGEPLQLCFRDLDLLALESYRSWIA